MKGVDSNSFDLSHDLKLSFSMGELIPTCVMECIPGDKVSINIENMLRFAPLISPVMHTIKVKTEYFFVPNRLLWSEWEKWIVGDSEVQAPYMPLQGNAVDIGSLADYVGIPTGTYTTPMNCSPLAIAAYLKIYDDWYRDQNLIDEKFVPLVAGPNNDYLDFIDSVTGQPLHRAWGHDYFTSALPFAQKGDPVQLPLTTGSVPVEYVPNASFPGTFREAGSTDQSAPGAVAQTATGVAVAGDEASYDPEQTLFVDVQSDAVTINTLRRAFRLQEWLEKNARAGTRYIESIFAHFGIESSDKRLQRPELLGSSVQRMVISEVLSTAQTDSGMTPTTTPLGQMAGHGISVGGGRQMSYNVEEHGWIIGIISVIPDTAYQQGLHRKFTRFSNLDYPWPLFANIGEQEIFQREIDAVGGPSPDAVFGYIPRYSEMRFENSRVAGEFRDTLDFWHLGRIFATSPALNEAFISCFPDTRIFAVTESNEDHIWAHVFNNIRLRRKLPRHGIPTI